MRGAPSTGADGETVAVMRRGQVVQVDVIDDGRSGLPHWREATGQDEGGRGFMNGPTRDRERRAGGRVVRDKKDGEAGAAGMAACAGSGVRR
jgi:hypothetical protein